MNNSDGFDECEEFGGGKGLPYADDDEDKLINTKEESKQKSKRTGWGPSKNSLSGLASSSVKMNYFSSLTVSDPVW
jgi:hypothetical protein